MSDEVARPKGATARERALRIGRLLREFNLGDGRMDAIEREILAAEREAVEAFVRWYCEHRYDDGVFLDAPTVEAWLRSRGEE